MSGGSIHVQTLGAVAYLTVSNPAKLNAMTRSMWTALRDAVLALDEIASVRVLVLGGEGTKAFVSGADVSEFGAQRAAAESAADYDAAVLSAQRALQVCSKPTIARLDGICFGGGLGLALACDLRYASSVATFRMPAARLGLGYAYEAMEQLVHALGAPRALELFLTARKFDAMEARRIGVVHDVFQDESFAAEFDAVVEAVGSNAPLTMRAAKAAIRGVVIPQKPGQRASIDALVRACFASSDYREGQQAFRERRPPRFAGA
ncbi:enoyl-CoA hydratase [Azohydromonas australica]|uniref:enoyl-CoA hydratase n=1 Tax=Azohydromonas australica TaxID=364039 RepID=UPI0003FDA051|nr:enoyl-CoA hydratase [Azohydromonas australica]